MLTKEIVNTFSENAEIGSFLYFDRVEKTDPFGTVMKEKRLILVSDGYVVEMYGNDPECLEGKIEPYSFQKFAEIDSAIEAYNAISMTVLEPLHYS